MNNPDIIDDFIEQIIQASNKDKAKDILHKLILASIHDSEFLQYALNRFELKN